MRGSLVFLFVSRFVAAVAGTSVAAGASAATLSGLYDGLLLAVRDGQVSGAFATARGIGLVPGTPQFSCAFLLRGKLSGERAEVTTWTPGEDAPVPGTLILTPSGATLQLREDQPGCGMAAGDMVHSPMSMTRDTRNIRDTAGEDWTDVRMVAARRAVLHAAPQPDSRTAPYLVRYDAVAVVAARPGWVQVRYFGSEKPVTGWLRDADLVPRDWPVRQAGPR